MTSDRESTDPTDPTDPTGPNDWLSAIGVVARADIGLAVQSGVGIGLATPTGCHGFSGEPAELVRAIDATYSPRWVWWDRTTADLLAANHVAVSRCWDVLTVHRLLHGGWRTSVPHVWAWLHELPSDGIPQMGQMDLLGSLSSRSGDEGDADDPVRPDGYLRPEWAAGGFSHSPARLARWAATAVNAAMMQRARVDARPDPGRTLSAAHSESAAEFMCAELAAHGLPIDRIAMVELIADAVGPRPANFGDEERLRAERDQRVLEHVPPGPRVDLRSPADVKSMLRRVEVDVPDTRAWRLEEHRDRHRVVEELLRWRKAERIATTYGYRWLDEHVATTPTGGRLRGDWSSSDGAAGRMTASAGLHNLPAELRQAVAADPGHLFVRADLGQIEPRVLAAVSADPALIQATRDDDLYQPIAQRLRVERSVAKVAVLGAMYGATTGESAHALRRLEQAYPVAMAFLESAAEQGRRGESVMTVGGRLIRMWSDDPNGQHFDAAGVGSIDRARQVAAARGRFARNALIQGAAAEFFKVWAITFRARAQPLQAHIVLCLHDELLIHVPAVHAEAAAQLVHDALAEAAFRWSPVPDVRFTADVSVISRWSDAK
ncbi:MAG TPA: DNA polymerase [Ilumatobacter sp.]|nr:DNA polymerase [Ilumatobacter sp.]